MPRRLMPIASLMMTPADARCSQERANLRVGTCLLVARLRIVCAKKIQFHA